MLHRIALATVSATLLALAGCATISGSPTQPLSIHTVDAKGKPVSGMHCRLANGEATYYGNSPLLDVQVRRSGSDLEIECRGGGQIARGTAFARSPALSAAVLLPGGGAAAVIDRLSGYVYAYPRTMQLRIGEHMMFDVSAPAQDSAEENTDSLLH
ncbi:MAG: hypothetical protein ACM3PU_08260 [Gemmatimonadota bacterium]